MAAPELSFDDVLQAFEAARAAHAQLGDVTLHPPTYVPEEDFLTLASIEHYKQAQARYDEHAAAQTQAAQHLAAAQVALDAWFPAPVLAAFDQGRALVAPAAPGVLVLIRHQGTYLLERGATQQEALNKLERFLNQF